MKDELKFTVTLKGRWTENGKTASAADVLRELREALNDHFEFMVDHIAVERTPK